MKAVRNRWTGMKRMLARLLRDDSGQALTEYAVIMVLVAGAAFYLYYPHNGLFESMRTVCNNTLLLLVFPGP